MLWEYLLWPWGGASPAQIWASEVTKGGPWEHEHKRRAVNSKQPVVLLSHLVAEIGLNGGLLVNSWALAQFSCCLSKRGMFSVSRGLVTEFNALSRTSVACFSNWKGSPQANGFLCWEKKWHLRKKLKAFARCNNSQGRKIIKQLCFSEQAHHFSTVSRHWVLTITCVS